MREIKLRKEKKPQYDPKENEKSQKMGNRDIPLGGPTTVSDTTFYGRAKSIMPEQPTPKPNVPKAMKALQEKEAQDALKKEREKLERDPKSSLQGKSESSGRQ